jgi:Toprim-like/CHC2 zinc finger
MNIRKQVSCEEIRKTDMVVYLSRLGFVPYKICRADYWYLSPLRKEKTASFKINRNKNCWFDFGIGKGGNIIDFAILYHDCTVGEFLKMFQNDYYYDPQPILTHRKDNEDEGRVKIIYNKTISSLVLIRYLHKRNIPLSVAERYCSEIIFRIYSKNYVALGFKNDSLGYELRNEFFKGSSSPKDITTFKNKGKQIAVFEGFFDFLSFISFISKKEIKDISFCILNSLSFFEKSRTFLEKHETIHLYLDNDAAGIKTASYAKKLSQKYIDESGLYKNYKDLNDWVMNLGKGNLNESEQ